MPPRFRCAHPRAACPKFDPGILRRPNSRARASPDSRDAALVTCCGFLFWGLRAPLGLRPIHPPVSRVPRHSQHRNELWTRDTRILRMKNSYNEQGSHVRVLRHGQRLGPGGRGEGRGFPGCQDPHAAGCASNLAHARGAPWNWGDSAGASDGRSGYAGVGGAEFGGLIGRGGPQTILRQKNVPLTSTHRVVLD